MRYMHSLERKNLALQSGDDPAGFLHHETQRRRQTIPITAPDFAELHPVCPPEQAEALSRMIAQLADWLVKLTGYDAVCTQPNSGAQGEYAGLPGDSSLS
ncbi:hypothetical protein ACNKHV_18050 [Shigella flexneri]